MHQLRAAQPIGPSVAMWMLSGRASSRILRTLRAQASDNRISGYVGQGIVRKRDGSMTSTLCPL
jgi:hypothetical protein